MSNKSDTQGVCPFLPVTSQSTIFTIFELSACHQGPIIIHRALGVWDRPNIYPKM